MNTFFTKISIQRSIILCTIVILLQCGSITDPNSSDDTDESTKRLEGYWALDSTFIVLCVNNKPVDTIIETFSASKIQFILHIYNDTMVHYIADYECWRKDLTAHFVMRNNSMIYNSTLGTDTVPITWDGSGYKVYIEGHYNGDTTKQELDHFISYNGTVPAPNWPTVKCNDGTINPNDTQQPDTTCQSIPPYSFQSWRLDSVNIHISSQGSSGNTGKDLFQFARIYMDTLTIITKNDSCYSVVKGAINADISSAIIQYKNHADTLNVCIRNHISGTWDKDHQNYVVKYIRTLFTTGNELLTSGERSVVTREYSSYDGMIPPASWGYVCGNKLVHVRGIVLDNFGEPVNEAINITILGNSQQPFYATITTDTNGLFSANLFQGDYFCSLYPNKSITVQMPQKTYFSSTATLKIDTLYDTMHFTLNINVADANIRGRIADTLSDSIRTSELLLLAYSNKSPNPSIGYFDSLHNFSIPVSSTFSNYTLFLRGNMALYPLGMYILSPDSITNVAPGDTGITFCVVKIKR
jgi:hypothetical protein